MTFYQQETELLHKLTAKKMSPLETLILIFSSMIPLIPEEWRIKIYLFFSSNQKFQFILILIEFLIITSFLIILVIILTIFIKLLLFRRSLKNKNQIFLELTPPSRTLQSSYATTELFNLIHNLASPKGFIDKLLQKREKYSLEIVASKEEGIKYIIQIPIKNKEVLKKTLLAYLPSARIREVSDFLPEYEKSQNLEREIIEFRLSQNFAYPIKSQKTLKEHDPIAYITGNMTKLNTGELIALQLVAVPVKKDVAKKANHITNAIIHNEDMSSAMADLFLPLPLKFVLFLIKLCGFILLSFFTVPFGIIEMLASNDKYGQLFPHRDLFFPTVRRVSYTKHQERIVEEVKSKVNQRLFEASLRVLFYIKDSYSLKQREEGLISSFSTFENPGWQEIETVRITSSLNALIKKLFKKLAFASFAARSTFFSEKSVLSISELSDIYHFPYTETTKTEDLQKVRSKELPAPLSLKKTKANLDVFFGVNAYGDQITPIGLRVEQRREHMYILGKTGAGKSTMLSAMIAQDILNGKGLVVIDPHGDLINTLLPVIPKKRIKDIVFFNPDDEEYPIGFNLLDLSKTASSKEKDFVVSSLISLFQKLYPPRFWGPRMEYILRNATLTALELDGSTIFTIQRLITDTNYRSRATVTLKNEFLKKFWSNEFEMAGDYQKVQMISPITNKIGRLLSSSLSRNILGQRKTTIDFDEIVNSGKILLCDLSKGKIGPDQSEIFGVLLIARLQLAALKRVRMEQKKRRDFYLYVDEFQNFATSSFASVMSEARKYRLNAILAHQTISQIEDHDLVRVILANVGTVLCFKTANPVDEDIILPVFSPTVEKHEIANLPNHHFYIKINDDDSPDAFSGISLDFKEKGNKKTEKEIIENSRKTYGRPKTEVEQEIISSFSDIKGGQEEKPGKERKKKGLMGRR